jgi:NADH:ubiquinone oxidoreductase subunit 5 (subunit L)/multisubunit Na+/H+ antiporter MnhA subunit
LSKKWFFDKFYNFFVVSNSLSFGYSISYKTIDRGIVELFGPFGFVFKVYSQGRLNSFFQSGLVYHYLFIMLVGVSIISLCVFILSYGS